MANKSIEAMPLDEESPTRCGLSGFEWEDCVPDLPRRFQVRLEAFGAENMGGMGSGRHWQRDDLLAPHQAFGWQWSRPGEVMASIRVRTEPGRVILTCRHRSGGEDWNDKSYPVYLDWNACGLGGQRPWFLCPARGCDRRVAILYMVAVFSPCRHCYRLAYPNQREPYDDRAARRADRIREKLGWEPGILNSNGCKPKGMHWRTFERLTAQHHAFVQISLAGVAARLNLPGELLDNWI